MIIWLNGAFGAGKTQTAISLRFRLPNAFIYDPEEAGFYIRSNIPDSMQKSDFQQHTLWRSIVYEHLAYMAANKDNVIIVPMTITEPSYYKEIVGKLRKDGHQVHHLVLTASEETLRGRLAKRGNKQNSWAAQQITRCLQGLSNPIFENKLITDNMSIAEVVEAVGLQMDLHLQSDPRSWWRIHWPRLTSRWR
ncbi:AAA family ATPase [Terribacillus saccharophilus]|uniref:AAA family ATPase n=1 Tax=Terribacillus saccharophilus TaxID=361277 RepID=UPI003982177B